MTSIRTLHAALLSAGLLTAVAVAAQGPAPTIPPPATATASTPAAGRGDAAQTAAGRGRGAGVGQPGGAGQGRGRGPAQPEPDFSPKPPIVAVSPAEEQKRFFLMPGYRLTPVLTEPDVMEPMQIAFDGNGRMFVLELLSYMQDADAGGELEPINRISVHEDIDNDGTYEKHAVFVDKLVFPRFVLPFGPNSILTMESNTDDVYRYTDTDGDSVADKKELFTTGFGRSGNVEHQQSSLLLAMDNWMYSTYNAFRIRWTPNGVIREATGSNGSQWGITQDSYGKVFFQGGASGLPGYFDFPIHYGNVNVPGRFEPGLDIPWGTAGLADYQGGFEMARLPDQTLARTTAGAGNDVFRGDRLPEELVGDYFYGEVTARSVRRLDEVVTEGLPQLRNVYQVQHAEFIRSTDPLFRPVDQATAPDGTMYIVDAYRGIIQEGNWTRPDSYLRRKVDQYQLDKVIRKGRIWRLTYEGIERDRTMPRMHQASPAQLVAHLSHPNGWWRDTAQQLLVLKQDKSVVPALEQVARAGTSLFGRFHALWTLEGLNALDPSLVREQLEDARPEIRIQALRLTESLFRNGNRTLEPVIRSMVKDADANVVIQAMLTARFLKLQDLPELIRTAQAGNPSRGVAVIGNQFLAPPAARGGGGGGRGNANPELAAGIARGEAIYTELCFSCHGTDGRGAPKEGGAPGATMAPALAGSQRVQGHRDYVIKTLLYGLTGPLDGQTYTEVMIPMGSNNDEWIADIASYVRTNFGNTATRITAADVAAVRAATANRRTSWTQPELDATTPVLIATDTSWKATASHNPERAPYGLNFVAWSSNTAQEPGMWFQVELPSPITLTELQWESTAGGRGGVPTGAFSTGGGGGGGGARGQAGPPPIGFPREFQIQVSMDGIRWSAVAQGQGAGAMTTVTFRPVQARFVRITQTATDPTPWSIQRLRLYAPGSGR